MDWVKDTPWFWWVATGILLALLELVSLDFFFIMLALAALAAAVPAAVGAGFSVQAAVFCLAAILLLLVVRPLARRRLTPATHATNVHALIGRQALALTEVTPASGLVKLVGEEWTARSSDGIVHAAGDPVRVTAIDGATAIVETYREFVS